MLDPRQAERLERRAAARRARVYRKRRIAAVAVAVLVVIIVIALATAGSGDERPRPQNAAAAARKARSKPPPILPGGPLAPARYGGLAALWARQNVIGT